jgi:hypothetical protein
MEQSLMRRGRTQAHENGILVTIRAAMDEGRNFCDAPELAEQSDLAAATNP